MPEQYRMLNDHVLVQRVQSDTQVVDDVVFGGGMTVAFDDVGGGLVLPSKRIINRAVVISAGPKCEFVRTGMIVGVPCADPLAIIHDSEGSPEIWQESTLDYAAEVREVEG